MTSSKLELQLNYTPSLPSDDIQEVHTELNRKYEVSVIDHFAKLLYLRSDANHQDPSTEHQTTTTEETPPDKGSETTVVTSTSRLATVLTSNTTGTRPNPFANAPAATNQSPAIPNPTMTTALSKLQPAASPAPFASPQPLTV